MAEIIDLDPSVKSLFIEIDHTQDYFLKQIKALKEDIDALRSRVNIITPKKDTYLAIIYCEDEYVYCYFMNALEDILLLTDDYLMHMIGKQRKHIIHLAKYEEKHLDIMFLVIHKTFIINYICSFPVSLMIRYNRDALLNNFTSSQELEITNFDLKEQPFPKNRSDLNSLTINRSINYNCFI